MKSPRTAAIEAAVVLGLALVVPWPASGAEADVIPFESDQWVMLNAETGEYLGRTCLMGTAHLEGVEFQNGVIEVDIAVDGRRTYVGVDFRIQSQRDYEQFYLRPHRASLYPDALQYTPVFNGISCWQLYNGEGYTAGADLPENVWIHVRLEVKGDQARVFLGDDEKPALVISRLMHGVSSGTVGLYGRPDGSAYFSNFSYRLDDDLEFDPPPTFFFPVGMINDWELSQAFSTADIDLELHPDSQDLPDIRWQAVEPEVSGMVNIARHTGRTGRLPDCVIARTAIELNEADRKKYRFGYSDYVSIFLNGDIVFSANSAYQKRDPSFLGVVGLNEVMYLNLKKGRNELLFLVAESFGGWAVICQDAEAILVDPDMGKAWETEAEFAVPEAVVYDEASNAIYVSNYDAYNPSGGMGKQAISKVSVEGDILDLEWVTGLNNPTGMAVFDGKLLVVERAGVVEIDIGTGEIAARHLISAPGFLNDIAIDRSGKIYVSDSRKGVIYRRENGEFEEWLVGGDIEAPNGLHIHDDRLLIGNNGDASLKAADLTTGDISTIARFEPGVIDGIRTDGAGNILVSHWEGRIYCVTPSVAMTSKLLDTSVPGPYCADFEYIPAIGLIVIPTFFENTLHAYHLW